MKSFSELKLSIIIVNFNSGEYLSKTVNSILENYKRDDFEIIIVDNNSTDDSLKRIDKNEKIKIIKLDKNIGFGAANNIGAKKAQGKYLFILNNDTLINKETIPRLMDFYENSEYGAVGPLVLYPDKSFQISFGTDLNLFSEFILKYIYEPYYKLLYKLKKGKISRKVDWLSGVCFLIEKEIYQKIGGFDEIFFIYLEDCDFFRRLRGMGYTPYYYTEASIIHFKGKSTEKVLSFVYPLNKKSQLFYYCKYNKKSLPLLKFYLLSKLKIKLIFSGDKKNIKDTIKTIREFKCEDSV